MKFIVNRKKKKMRKENKNEKQIPKEFFELIVRNKSKKSFKGFLLTFINNFFLYIII